MRKLGTRGGFNLGGVIWLALLVMAVYHAWVFGQPYYQKVQFEDELYDIAETVFRQSDDVTKKAITDAAARRGIPLDPGKITRTEDGSTMTIQLWWDVPVKTFLIERTLHYQVTVSRKFTR